MQSTAIKKMKLMQKITQLPEQKLGEVETFLKRIFSQLGSLPFLRKQTTHQNITINISTGHEQAYASI